jgi:hypothetical protein
MRQCLETSDAEARLVQLEAQLNKTAGRVIQLKTTNG